MRIVLDTNILARSILNPSGLAMHLLRWSSTPPHSLVLSQAIVDELACVLRYDRMRKLHGLNDADIDCAVAAIGRIALVAPASSSESCRGVASHPADDAIIATAVAGQADVICTLDKHFLEAAVQAYCREHGIRILSDTDLLKLSR